MGLHALLPAKRHWEKQRERCTKMWGGERLGKGTGGFALRFVCSASSIWMKQKVSFREGKGEKRLCVRIRWCQRADGSALPCGFKAQEPDFLLFCHFFPWGSCYGARRGDLGGCYTPFPYAYPPGDRWERVGGRPGGKSSFMEGV